MTLDELTAKIDKRNPGCIGPADAWFEDIYGDPCVYLTMACTGIKKEGGPLDSFSSKEIACETMWRTWLREIPPRISIVWRRRPELVRVGRKYAVTMRLVAGWKANQIKWRVNVHN